MTPVKAFFSTAAERFAYVLSMVTANPAKPYLQKHEEALDCALAQKLSVPGLDAYVLRPRDAWASPAIQANRLRAFESAHRTGLMLQAPPLLRSARIPVV